MAANPEQRLTWEEYLEIERKAEVKSEFVDGEMFLMAGASANHNRIVRNVVTSLAIQTQAGNCEVFPSDMRVKIQAIEKGTYPDISIVCGEQLFGEGEEKNTLLNPRVIIEVLSDTTEAYDRGKKFQDYQLLDSLTEYILISQTPYRIEQFVRQPDGSWNYRQYNDEESVIGFESVDCALALKDVYLKVA